MLTRAQWFSILDMKNGYWYVQIHQDKENTVFLTPNRLLQFNVSYLGSAI